MIRPGVHFLRGADADVGGGADLQTDVMRFMAILGLCLVAIFALVQSLPSAPGTVPAAAEAAADRAIDTGFVAESQPEARTEAAPPLQARASALPGTAANHPVPVPPERSLDTPTEGFTLRFESDQALEALVARGEVSLYAIRPGRALRLRIDGDRLALEAAAVPRAYHEMDAATVPDDIRRRFDARDDNGGMRWAVTLPSTVTGRIDRLVAAESGGDLVIDAGGGVRVE